jgi:U3 small nucleolar ribonucleoprotein protein LCP5
MQLSRINGEDKEKSVELLTTLKDSVSEVVPIVKQLIKKGKHGELNMAKGVSFLDVKNHQMLSYLINLTHLMHQKASGISIKESADIDRLVECRTVLEKMRPAEQKLKYQLDKLVRMGSGIGVAENDPLRLRPNPDKLVSKLDDDNQADNGSDDEASNKPQVYKPAKLVPVFYDGDETAKQRQERQIEKGKKRMANSAVMRDLYQQYTDGPEEIRDAVGLHRAREDRKGRERREYEENYFIRKSLTKKEQNAEKQMRTVSGLNDITSFPDFSMFGADSKRGKDGDSRKRSSSSKAQKGSAKKRKFRK